MGHAVVLCVCLWVHPLKWSNLFQVKTKCFVSVSLNDPKLINSPVDFACTRYVNRLDIKF